MRRIDFNSMALFVAVCETGAIARAAARENIVASAISKRLAELESDFGVPLLERGARGVKPTAAGEALLFHARAVLRGVDRLQAELSDYAQGVRGHVRMHANISAVVEFLPEDLRVFMANNEGIKIDLQEHLSADILRAVAEGQTDLGVVSASEEVDGLTYFPYRQDELVLVVRPDHPLAATAETGFAASLAYDHVGLSQNSSLYTLLEHAAAAAGLTRRLRIHVTAFDALCRMVDVGLGVGVVPRRVGNFFAAALGLRLVGLTDAWATRNLHIVVRDVASLPAAARLLLDHLVRVDDGAGPTRTD
ncbi:LysR family transcriptional regulator [Azoarcus sp. L1K30]|uniref:LysR family transcriptional regulator n=1 Tax=Azoarcus sp. L1K30 TaxID=2820277 RepID=UPI001B818211|nr:LysR family transcriptional regulator [Azoarcus sp. L1K30]MBR0564703.1 LysR family transcriptional regulator [Azoarcus sp. L1K30]